MSVEQSIQHTEARAGLPKKDPVDKREPVKLLEEFTKVPQERNLGKREVRFDIPSEIAPFNSFPEYKVAYPNGIKKALTDMYEDYNQAFKTLVEANSEWPEDYQYAMDKEGNPVNYFVRVDMVGLPETYLEDSKAHDEGTVKRTMQGCVFEFENAPAMNNLVTNLFPRDGEPSTFKEGLDKTLDGIRDKFDKKIALLAVNDEKCESIKSAELGMKEGETISDERVKELSGFDTFFTPDTFKQYLTENNGECDYLLYVRTSEPTTVLRKPKEKQASLLEDDAMRKTIKANAITFNIDNPAWDPKDSRRINDTKAYLSTMGMAHEVTTLADIFTTEGKRDTTFEHNPHLFRFLQENGATEGVEDTNGLTLRGKPKQGTYGSYGHVTGSIQEAAFRKKVKEEMKNRGPYLIQPEMTIPEINDNRTGESYMYIDRNYMGVEITENGDPQPFFISGIRAMMPIEKTEAQKGRVHGNSDTAWAEIL